MNYILSSKTEISDPDEVPFPTPPTPHMHQNNFSSQITPTNQKANTFTSTHLTPSNPVLPTYQTISNPMTPANHCSPSPRTSTQQPPTNQMMILSPQNLAPNFGVQSGVQSANHSPAHTTPFSTTPFSQGDIGGLFQTPQS